MDELIKLAERNMWAALGLGMVTGLWLLGGFPDREKKSEILDALPNFSSAEAEEAWHLKRLEILRAEKQMKRREDEVLSELHELVNQMNQRIQTLEKEKLQ